MCSAQNPESLPAPTSTRRGVADGQSPLASRLAEPPPTSKCEAPSGESARATFPSHLKTPPSRTHSTATPPAAVPFRSKLQRAPSEDPQPPPGVQNAPRTARDPGPPCACDRVDPGCAFSWIPPRSMAACQVRRTGPAERPGMGVRRGERGEGRGETGRKGGRAVALHPRL
ncbi:hypothetical protein AcV7_007300 [Taiwanofungus camphoratus]|nr:hypothetical protein AcV7_007300 [Antrodia cinnamomea]